MLPNDPMLALREANATMAHRHHEASQERLGAHARLVTKPDPAKASVVRSVIRPATLFVTVVLALTALIGASSASVPNVAAKRMLATSSSKLLDDTASRRRLLAIAPSGDVAQQQATRRRVLL